MKAKIALNQRKRTGFKRGGALLGTLIFTAIISSLLAAAGLITLSHYKYTLTETDYSYALNLAEAGVNFELRKISQNAANADQIGNSNGVTYTLGRGQYTVYCTNPDATTPWSGSGNLYILSTGSVNGVSRTIKVSSKSISSSGSGNYAIYPVNSGTWSSYGHINGDVGTNGTLLSKSGVAVNGSIVLNGPGTSTSGSFSKNSQITNPNPIVWPYVHDIALSKLPSGGMSWLTANNDNALCNSIHSNQISLEGGTVTFPSKAGGANYYLTYFTMAGSGNIQINNTLGPVTIWLGPDGGAGSDNGNPHFDFRSTVNISYTSLNPANRCIFYDGTTGPFTLESDGIMNVGIYAYNKDAQGHAIGSLDYRSPTTINGFILANTIIFEAEGYVNYATGYPTVPGTAYYGYADQWLEIPNY